jgi:hypothetical protein
MSHNRVIQDFRNTIQKEIIVESTSKNLFKNKSDGVLQLRRLFYFYCETYRPYEPTNPELVIIKSIDCLTGDLNGTDLDSNYVRITYSDLPLEKLAELNEIVVLNKDYDFVPSENLNLYIQK